MYQNFQYYTPTKVIFGRDTEGQTGQLVKQFGGTRVLIHYGSGSVVRSGLLDRVKQSLEEAGIFYVTLGGVVPNPHLGKVYEGIDLCRKEKVDFILAVGGGSVIDSAKAIAVGLANPDTDVWEFYLRKARSEKTTPVAAVLTIAATGSEMSSSSVITNEQNGLKRSYGGDFNRPKFAVLNPELTMTLPAYQTASGAADIMMHTMERFFNRAENMNLVDRFSISLMRDVMKYSRLLMVEPDNYNARAELMWAGSLSHNGLTGCATGGGDWATHKMEHELGGMFDVAHGAGLAALWGTWARTVWQEAPERFLKFATEVMEVTPGNTPAETVEQGIRAVERFYRDIQMPTNLRQLGVCPTQEQILFMADSCTQANGGTIGTVKKLTAEDVADIYRTAL